MKKIKKGITLSISKYLETHFDHQFDVIEAHNKGTFETVLGSWIFFLTQQV